MNRWKLAWAKRKAKEAQAQVAIRAWLDEYQQLLVREALLHFRAPPSPACLKLIRATAGMTALVQKKILNRIWTYGGIDEFNVALDYASRAFVRLANTEEGAPIRRTLLARLINEQCEWAGSAVDLMGPVGHA